MKSTLVNLIATLVRRLVGGELWALIAITVKQVDALSITGTEKREAVEEAAQTFASGVATWLINLAIETAVAKLRTGK